MKHGDFPFLPPKVPADKEPCEFCGGKGAVMWRVEREGIEQDLLETCPQCSGTGIEGEGIPIFKKVDREEGTVH